ncbi:hypothetical protein HK101_011942 [Irineochytrium annulatum]|nr:hypothetical protein HK101_011942 [Irineochytrium annulatum]
MSVSYLRSLEAVRGRTSALLKHPEHLQNFDLDLSVLPSVVDSVVSLIRRDYSSPSVIPPHSRWRHFEVAPPGQKAITRVHTLLESWTKSGVDKLEAVRRLLDLFVVSVLLDAGAGPTWKYTTSATCKPDPNTTYGRSEGLAIASLDWFLAAGFSSDPANPHRADSKGLAKVSTESLNAAFQVADANPLVGADGRVKLLQALGRVCDANPQFFGEGAVKRPGNMVDYLLAHPTTVKGKDGHTRVQVKALWTVVMDGLGGIWPASRTKLDGVSLGDVWPSKAMAAIAKAERGAAAAVPGEELIAFHKLSQWLSYSLMEPLSLVGISFDGIPAMTGLAEYRNGGLFVDFGVITLRKPLVDKFAKDVIPRFEVFDDVIVEWRGLTVALLDLVGKGVREKLGMTEEELPLVKVLEAGTWKLGREIAAKKRPDTKGPPIEIISDGTVF